MPGRITWCRPGSRKHLKTTKRTVPANLPALLLLIGLIAVVVSKLFTSLACGYAGEPDSNGRADWRASFLQKALGEAIPGLERPPLIEKQTLARSALDLFHSVTGADPRDLRTVLNFELGAGSPVLLPVFSPTSSDEVPGGQERDNAHPSPSMPEKNNTASEVTLNPGTGPVILIYHTHITESFLPTSRVLFTNNMDLTVCRLGKELAELLQIKYGFTVIHHREIYDQPRQYAYEKARPAIENLLNGREPINLVLDIHRDGVSRDSTTADLGEGPLGKILFVIGSNHPNFGTNLKFTLHLQRELEALVPGLSRGIRQQNFVYNQDLHPYSLLVEIGGHENSLEEVMKTVPYLAEAVARAYGNFFKTEE